MDGFKENLNVKILAATNRIDILDPALLRAGRFDRLIEVPTPSPKAREEIFKIHSRSMKLAPNVELEKLSNSCDRMTGADIRSVCMEAGILALRNDRKSIQLADFQQAIEKVRSTNFKTDDSAQSQKMFA